MGIFAQLYISQKESSFPNRDHRHRSHKMSYNKLNKSNISFLSTPESVPSTDMFIDHQRHLKSGMVLDEKLTVSNNFYHDHSHDTEEDVERDLMIQLSNNIKSFHTKRKKVKRGARGGVSDPFPLKLHRMLENVEHEGNTHIVSWQPHGRCFLVHKPKDFVNSVMCEYFRQTKLTSFQRQLNLYGFCRLTKGVDAGAYYHEFFLRGMAYLSERIIRTKIKSTGHKSPSKPQMEPHFYTMRPITTRKDNSCCNAVTSTSPSVVSSSSSPSSLTSDDLFEKEGDIVSFEGESFHYLDAIEPFQLSSILSSNISGEIAWLEESDDFSIGLYLDQLVDSY